MAIRSLAVKSEFSKYLVRWSRDLKVLRQNWLLSESAFLSFARDRGITASGIVRGEPSEFHERGWLSADARIGKDLEFHPFRVHVLHQALAHKHVDSIRLREWNGTADLSILLEPIYWPEIVGHLRGSFGDTQKRQSARYRLKVLKLAGWICASTTSI